jgi:AcrR family transcriptional regulator
MTIEQPIQPSRRLRKKERTRRQIQEVAIRLFLEKGFDNVTISEIAEQADVDVTTLWRHFKSKHVILYADQEPWIAEFKETLAGLPQELGPFEAGLEALMRTPPIGAPELEVFRAQIVSRDPAPEVHAATLVFEDIVRQEMTQALAARMKVDPLLDPRPSILSETILAAARWLRKTFSFSMTSGGVVTPFHSFEDMIRDTMKLIPR